MATRKQQPPKPQQNPEELVEVIWADTRQEVKLPRRLLQTGNKRAQTDYLIATGQLVDPNATPLPDMQEPAEVVQQVVDNGATAALDARLSALEGRKQQELPSNDALSEWSRQAQRVALSHQEMNAVAEQTATACEQVGRDAQQRLDGLDEQQAAMLGKVSEAVSEGQTSVGLAIQSLEQRSAATLADIEQEALLSAQEIARQQRGPQGLAGAGVVISPEDPSKVEDENYGNRWFGRSLVEGDGVLQTGKSGIVVWRRAAGRWLKSSELVPKTELVSQQLSIHDESKPATVVLGSVGGSGSSGGGSDRLTTRTIANGALTTIADSSNWSAGGTTINSCVIHMRISTGTGSAFLSAAINVDPAGNTELTEYSLLGTLTGTTGFSVDLTAKLGNPVVPPSVTPPPAVTQQPAMFVTAMVRGLPPTGGFLEGVVIWLPRAQGSTSDPKFSPVSPLWVIT